MKPSIGFEEYVDCSQLYYDDVKNVMIDEDGIEIFNIFSIISPNTLYLFKTNKDYMMTYDVYGRPIELIWPEHEGQGGFDMGQHKNNPTAQLAKEDKLPPKKVKVGKRKLQSLLEQLIYESLTKNIGSHPGRWN